MTDYRSYNIFPYLPDLTDDPSESYPGAFETIQDIGIGRSVAFWDQAAGRFTALFSGMERDEIADIQEFFDNHAGRLTPFWLAAFQPSLTVTAAFLSTDTVISIDEESEYVSYWLNRDATGRHLMFEWADGTQVCKKVTDADVDTITLESALGKACTASDLPHLRVYFLYFVRFDSDTLEAVYPGPTVAEMKMTFREIPWEAPTS